MRVAKWPYEHRDREQAAERVAREHARVPHQNVLRRVVARDRLERALVLRRRDRERVARRRGVAHRAHEARVRDRARHDVLVQRLQNGRQTVKSIITWTTKRVATTFLHHDSSAAR